jgi:serine/threonine protein phosphatase 1
MLRHEARLSKEACHRWIRSDGDATPRSSARAENAPDSHSPEIPEAHWLFLEHRLLPFYETAAHFFVHAGASPGLPLPEQSDFMPYHKKFVDPPPHASGTIMVCGHTPSEIRLARA